MAGEAVLVKDERSAE